MAKAPKSTDTQTKTVPNVELVGDHANDPKFYPSQTQTSNDDLELEPLRDQADEHNLVLLQKALDAFCSEHGTAALPVIRIISKSDGLRRGGQHHVGTVDHPLSTFTGKQLEQLLGEKLLVVEFISVEA